MAATSSKHTASSLTHPVSKHLQPFYVDLTYIPAHGDADKLDVDFFRHVRARYYVLSSACEDMSVLDMLLEAKAGWEGDSGTVTIIPTYDTDTLSQWMVSRKHDLDLLNVEVAPSANCCTIQLQDHTTTCNAFRLEF